MDNDFSLSIALIGCSEATCDIVYEALEEYTDKACVRRFDDPLAAIDCNTNNQGHLMVVMEESVPSGAGLLLLKALERDNAAARIIYNFSGEMRTFHRIIEDFFAVPVHTCSNLQSFTQTFKQEIALITLSRKHGESDESEQINHPHFFPVQMMSYFGDIARGLNGCGTLVMDKNGMVVAANKEAKQYMHCLPFGTPHAGGTSDNNNASASDEVYGTDGKDIFMLHLARQYGIYVEKTLLKNALGQNSELLLVLVPLTDQDNSIVGYWCLLNPQSLSQMALPSSTAL